MKEKTLVILDSVMKQGFTPVLIAVLKKRELSIEAKGLYMVLLMFAYGRGATAGNWLR
ncbi:hypothetical protein [Desulfofundulus thermosubterraneus]|uniref:Uncharacterized protein n=1 Tax=Desulfofundulus thermosubterraneus DSM 16057 TaxID=1121432 RepID=A0A1M6JJV8_9FIRM|nr:hypothetical protein [Desulfofundulus thermosubterraneus]SHJ46953.1 hypothetical protein SAMN02745219_02627 [Desulfofundulus thermosubterraneus DSM 16057]